MSAQALRDVQEALRSIVKGCEYRLKKGPDSGDLDTLRLATRALERSKNINLNGSK